MPTLRLEEVLKENQINLEEQSQEIQSAISRLLRTEDQPFDKLDVELANDLRVVAGALRISVFKLFQVTPKVGYRLRILEELDRKFPEDESYGDKIERLHREINFSDTSIPSDNQSSRTPVTLSILVFYATQVLPESILEQQEFRKKYLDPICQALDVTLGNLKEKSKITELTLNYLTISQAYKTGTSVDDLALLTDIPAPLLIWSRRKKSPTTLSFTENSSWPCEICEQTGNILSCWIGNCYG